MTDAVKDHCTEGEIQSFVDGTLATEDAGRVRDHLNACPRCCAVARGERKLGVAIRRLPRARVGRGFTDSVMVRIGVAPRSPLAFRLFSNLAYVVGLAVVCGIMAGVFVLTGVQDVGPSGNAGSLARETLAVVSGAFSDLSLWIAAFLPYAFGRSAAGISVLVVAAIGAIAVVDRLVLRRFARRAG